MNKKLTILMMIVFWKALSYHQMQTYWTSEMKIKIKNNKACNKEKYKSKSNDNCK